MSAFLNEPPDKYGVVHGAVCMHCPTRLTGSGIALDKAKRAHQCPAQPLRRTVP